MLATQYNEWISVKDSLPNKDCIVLICWKSYNLLFDIVDVGIFDFNKKQFFINGYNDGNECDEFVQISPLYWKYIYLPNNNRYETSIDMDCYKRDYN